MSIFDPNNLLALGWPLDPPITEENTYMSRLTATCVTFLLCLVAALTSSVVRTQDAAPAVTLKGYAVLPADTFSDGPPSGAQIDPICRSDD